MKRFIFIACIFSAVAIGCTSSETKKEGAMTTDSTAAVTDASADKMAETPSAPMDSAAMMKAWQAYMTPGEEHKMLAKSNGTWVEEITMWMDPNAPAQKSTAIAENRMILNGLYQESKVKGSFEGMPFEGISTLGYDNGRKVWVSSWIDNMGTGIMHMEGSMDPATGVLNLKGKGWDPATGKDVDMRETFKIIDDKNQYMEMFCTKDGKEFKTMEMKLVKK
ncbi:MAG TPA: DUF1579 domain-containing protein [Ferruginibacter sp.]|nr:DUF1579 domain-containing protein [Ferruginibacter sp.]